MLTVDRIVNWILFAWEAYEMQHLRRERQYNNSHIPV